jgi:hypothetical protein
LFSWKIQMWVFELLNFFVWTSIVRTTIRCQFGNSFSNSVDESRSNYLPNQYFLYLFMMENGK